jgi:hypothetical protein
VVFAVPEIHVSVFMPAPVYHGAVDGTAEMNYLRVILPFKQKKLSHCTVS